MRTGAKTREALLDFLRARDRGQDPAEIASFRNAEADWARLASAKPGAPLRGLLRHPRKRILGARLGSDPALAEIAALRAAGVLGEARFRALMIEWFLTRPPRGARS